MKYLKISAVLFLFTLIFAGYNVNAGQYINFINIKIPSWKASYISTQYEKDTQSVQAIMKTKCTDDLTGDGRVIVARTQGMYHGMYTSGWVESKPNVYTDFDSFSSGLGGYKLWLQSNKSLMTTATYSGTWALDK